MKRHSTQVAFVRPCLPNGLTQPVVRHILLINLNSSVIDLIMTRDPDVVVSLTIIDLLSATKTQYL